MYIFKYRIGGIFRWEKFSRILRFRKNYTQKTKFYMVHTLFLTDSRKFNPVKYTTYTVFFSLSLSLSLSLSPQQINLGKIYKKDSCKICYVILVLSKIMKHIS